MLINYLKIAWRQIWRNKLHATINFAGLAVSFTVFILLFLTAYYQLSYDEFHKDTGQLFSVSKTVVSHEGLKNSSVVPLPLGEAFKTDKWLQNYEYRIEISLIPFLLTGFLVCFLALPMVGLQTYRAAYLILLKSLRTE